MDIVSKVCKVGSQKYTIWELKEIAKQAGDTG